MKLFNQSRTAVREVPAPRQVTLEERAGSAAALAGFAIGQFTSAADTLDKAAAEQRAIATELYDEIVRLEDDLFLTAEAAGHSSTVAARIRGLVAA